MKDIYIIGLGQTAVGEHWERSLRDLAAEAIEPALMEANLHYPDALYVANAFSGQLTHQTHLGALIADFVGLRGIEAVAIEAGSASGGAAIRQAALALSSGLLDTALVVGVEKVTDVVGAGINYHTATGLDMDWEAEQGLTNAAAAGLIMQRYLHDYGVTLANFAGFSENAHLNAKGNPKAMFRNTLRPGMYEKAGMVATPVNMFDSAPDADGAAAVVLVTGEALGQMGNLKHKAVRLVGSALSTDGLALHDREDLLRFDAARVSAERALQQAEMTIGQIDVFELHDAYTIYTVLTLEALGLAEPGKGWQVAAEGRLGRGEGKLAISTFGGLKARGNPHGAAGVYQVVEAAQQLRGEAGNCQVEGARRALVQNLGGAAATAVTHILEATE